MDGGWYVAALFFGLGDWIAVATGRAWLRVVTKPGVMVALIAGFSLAGGWQEKTFWFGLGLVFCLVGDVMLLLPPGWFVGGLGAFLTAHIFYIIGFNQNIPRLGWESLALVVAVLGIDFFGYRRLRRALMAKPQSRWLCLPVLVYVIVISLMLLSALLTPLRLNWPPDASLLVVVGALLFYISDTVLAHNRFAGPIRGGRVMVIVTYHLAQTAIVSGVLLL